MNLKIVVLLSSILLSTFLASCNNSKDSQVSANSSNNQISNVKESNSKGSNPKEIAAKSGWKSFQAEGIELQLPKSFKGGSNKDLDKVIDELKSFGPQYQQLAQTVKINRSAIKIFAFDSKPGSSGLVTNVNAVNEKIPSNISLKQYLELATKQLPSDFKVSSQEIISVNGYPTGKVITEITNPSQPNMKAKQALYTVKKDNNIWVVVYTTGSKEFDEKLPVFEESINTIKIAS